jgi:hypothetical protein
MKNLGILIVLFASITVFGNDITQIEQDLVKGIKKIDEVSNYGENPDYDKQGQVNKDFREMLLKYGEETPETLTYDFTELKKHLFITTSPDNKLRIYSWDTGSGGTMHFYGNVYQFVGEDGKIYAISDHQEEGDPGGFYSDIDILKTKKGTVYITRQHSKLSTSLAGQTVALYRIEGKNLNGDYKLFKTRSGIKSSIGFSFDFFSVVDRPERPLKLIQYHSEKKELKIPVVIEDKKTPQGRVTNRFIKYRFNGKYFVKVKN